MYSRRESWPSVRAARCVAATTSVRIDRDLLARFPELPVGYAKPNSRIFIMDSAGGEVAAGTHGEIVIAGSNVSPGYWGRPDLTARSFFRLDGLQAYRTGDTGHFQDGLLFFDGRIDSQIKLHGYRIEIGDVEANLRALAGVRDAVVVPLYRDGRLDSLAAFVILQIDQVVAGFEGSLRLRRALAERVPAYMVPRVMQTVTSFPMTPNGKVDRRALVETLA
jgi:D-alanine--poly(phosphoribitol) ligase subunit 1